ncbi:MAG: hypothetical protein R3C02_09555 [Planctomycetaceae bacterium]
MSFYRGHGFEPVRPPKWRPPEDFPEHSPTEHFPQESIRGKRLCAGWDEAVLDGIAAFQPLERAIACDFWQPVAKVVS